MSKAFTHLTHLLPYFLNCSFFIADVWLSDQTFLPKIRRVGDFQTASGLSIASAMLAAKEAASFMISHAYEAYAFL
jgi:hypothetical protein